MFQFTAIASSSKGNCYHLTDGSSSLIIEAGVPWKYIRREITNLCRGGNGHYHPAGCLVTHSHMDHAKGVKDATKAAVNVYSAKETFDALGVRGHRCVVVRPHEQFAVGSFTVLPFDTIHDAPGSLGFLIASGEEKLLFLTDTAYTSYLFPGLTHIVVEANFSLEELERSIAAGLVHPSRKSRLVASHLSIERTIDLLKDNDLGRVKEIRLIHLSESNSDEKKWKRMVQATTGKAVYVEDE